MTDLTTSQPLRVLVLSTVPRTYPGHDEARGMLANAGYEVIDPGVGLLPEADAAQLASGVHALLVGGTHPVPTSVMTGAPLLRVIVREGIGMEKIDLGTATKLGIVVANTAGSNSDSVADHAIALMLAVLRDIRRLDQRIRDGVGWKDRQPLQQLAGRSLGMVGTGHVGQAVIKRAAGFGVSITAFDPITNPVLERDYGVTYVATLEELLSSADVVSLHAPLLPSTEGMIGARELGLMKSNAILINTARGLLVDNAALVEALREGTIAGAGLDAWPNEPVVQSPLFDLPNVIVTPHVGGNSTTSSFNARTWGARNLIDCLSGNPRDVVNIDVLSSPALRVKAR